MATPFIYMTVAHNFTNKKGMLGTMAKTDNTKFLDPAPVGSRFRFEVAGILRGSDLDQVFVNARS